ncbi:MrpF/PhaF family protein [Streptomyces sp. LP11]|uniref:MrpF/PhaF family protein n=1 Tax=Streptomyces pyxinicus TaxID=2970331 RepID=A0ABT2BAE3_9ACTN|nr:MrpF/PhaF family protein [Streptomyces sp. LP11]MCS0605481.1 MrpF/PhaF family protein [Streptomyces sp. LP11]
MNGWILAATLALGGGGAAVLWGVTTGPPARRILAQNLATSAVCPALLLLSQGYGRPSYVDLALLLALLGPVGTLVFARLLSDDLAGERPSAWGLTWTAAGLGLAAVVAACAAAGPGRAMVKLLVIGVLLIAGNVIASRALAGGFRRVGGG